MVCSRERRHSRWSCKLKPGNSIPNQLNLETSWSGFSGRAAETQWRHPKAKKNQRHLWQLTTQYRCVLKHHFFLRVLFSRVCFLAGGEHSMKRNLTQCVCLIMKLVYIHINPNTAYFLLCKLSHFIVFVLKSYFVWAHMCHGTHVGVRGQLCIDSAPC